GERSERREESAIRARFVPKAFQSLSRDRITVAKRHTIQTTRRQRQFKKHLQNMAFSYSSTFGHERAPGAGVTAVLGPTNTGKTHLAIERMLAHSSGIIGLPLRLLAREVYNKIADRAGKESVALITGEEKIKPKKPR